MLKILESIEKELPTLLKDESLWKSVFVDYHLPYVERLWTSITIDKNEYRIYLHRILPTHLEKCLYHPHPWPSAMKILSGQYKMKVGYGEDMQEPPVSTTLILPQGTYYEMIDPNSWHAVCPLETASFSLMVTGQPWGRISHKSNKILQPLSFSQEEVIFRFFKEYYQ